VIGETAELATTCSFTKASRSWHQLQEGKTPSDDRRSCDDQCRCRCDRSGDDRTWQPYRRGRGSGLVSAAVFDDRGNPGKIVEGNVRAATSPTSITRDCRPGRPRDGQSRGQDQSAQHPLEEMEERQDCLEISSRTRDFSQRRRQRELECQVRRWRLARDASRSWRVPTDGRFCTCRLRTRHAVTFRAETSTHRMVFLGEATPAGRLSTSYTQLECGTYARERALRPSVRLPFHGPVSAENCRNIGNGFAYPRAGRIRCRSERQQLPSSACFEAPLDGNPITMAGTFSSTPALAARCRNAPNYRNIVGCR